MVHFTIDYYSAIKENKILKFTDNQMELEMMILDEVTQTQTNATCLLSFVDVNYVT